MNAYWKNCKILVTGGTGFLGLQLCKQLCELGAQVRSFALPVNNDHPICSLPVEILHGDIRDARSVRGAVSGCDVIFHTAGNVAVWGSGLKSMRDIHINGTRNVFEASKGIRSIVHTSSIVAVGATSNGTILDEDSAFQLRTIKVDYVHAKKSAEDIALESNAIVVNPGYLIGPDDHEPSVMGKFCDRVWKGKMALAAPGGYNLVDVRDVARGHILAAEYGKPGRRYILGGANLQLRQFMLLLLEAAELSPRLLPKLPMGGLWLAAAFAELRSWKTRREPYPSFQHARLNQYQWYVSSERARKELGFQPRPIALSVNDTWESYSAAKTNRIRGFTKWWMRPKGEAMSSSIIVGPKANLVRSCLKTHFH